MSVRYTSTWCFITTVGWDYSPTQVYGVNKNWRQSLIPQGTFLGGEKQILNWFYSLIDNKFWHMQIKGSIISQHSPGPTVSIAHVEEYIDWKWKLLDRSGWRTGTDWGDVVSYIFKLIEHHYQGNIKS